MQSFDLDVPSAPDVPEEQELVSFDDYCVAALENLAVMSRTARGIVDTSASVDKAQYMETNLPATVAASRARENTVEALRVLSGVREHTPPTSTDELRAFIERIAQIINRGITVDGAPLLRSGADSAKHPSYTAVADLSAAYTQFVAELADRLRSPHGDPVALAAWIEYRIDLSDHFFTDGCGKIAKMVSAYALMRAGLPLPRYRGREEYYAQAPAARRSLEVPSDADPALARFTAYYRTLFPER